MLNHNNSSKNKNNFKFLAIIFGIIIIILLVIISYLLVSNNNLSSKYHSLNSSSSKSYKYKSKSILIPGEYEVGTDIKPGSYRITQQYGINGELKTKGNTIKIPKYGESSGIRVILKSGNKIDISGDADDYSSSVEFLISSD